MYQRPEHLVWIEIAGLLSLCALLLGPLLFLATEMMGGGRGGGGGAIGTTGSGPPSAAQSPPSQHGGTTPVPGLSPGRSAASPRGASSRGSVPFSDAWQAQATPDLSGSGPEAGGGALATGMSPGRTGRTSAPETRGAYGMQRGGASAASRSGGSRSGGSRPGWVAEAQRLAGRARALSRQLRSREDGGENQAATAKRSRTGGQAETAADNPGTPSEPTVPIDDHLHWLVVAGVLWGAWRLGRGA